MNRDTLEGKWNQVKGNIRRQWGKLTDDDVDIIKGNYEQLVGKVQERYGISRDKAEKQVKDWEV